MIKLNDNSTFIFLWNAFVSVCIVYPRKVSDIGTIIEIACLFGPHEKRRRNNNMPDLDESKMFCYDGNRKPNLQHLIQHIQYHNLNLVIL